MLKQFLNRPHSVRFRRWMFQIHLWVGTALALYAVIIGLTGSILVFRDQLEGMTHPEIGRVTNPQAPSLSLSRIVENVRPNLPPGELSSIFPPEEDRPTIRAYVRQKSNMIAVSIDPVTSKIVGTFNYSRDWLGWIADLHFRLLGGTTGQIVNAICATFLLVLFMTGCIIWWPGKKLWSRGMKVRLNTSAKRFNFDLHSAVGFWTLGILAIWAISGIYLIWPGAVVAVVNWISPVTTISSPALVGRILPGARRKSPIPFPRPVLTAERLENFVQQAEQRVPNGKLVGIQFPRGDRAPLAIYIARCAECDTETADFVYFNAVTGEYLRTWHRGEIHTIGDRILSLMIPLHEGNEWGLAVQILWAVLGLSLPTLAITGLIMYWNRYLGKKWIT